MKPLNENPIGQLVIDDLFIFYLTEHNGDDEK